MKAWTIVIASIIFAGCAKKQQVPVVTTPPAPAAPKPVAPRNAPAPPKPKPQTTPAAAATTPPTPILGTLLTPEQTQEHGRAIDESLTRAQKNMAVLHTRQLTPEQMRGIARVETFIRQARDARTQNDLVTARNFAERADLLSQDLLKQ